MLLLYNRLFVLPVKVVQRADSLNLMHRLALNSLPDIINTIALGIAEGYRVYYMVSLTRADQFLPL